MDQELTSEEVDELDQAEKLAKLFLAWDIDPETEDVRVKLQDMLDEVERMGLDDEDDGIKDEDEEDGRSGVRILEYAEDEGVYGRREEMRRGDQREMLYA